MAKIILKEPKGPYYCEIDTETMDVEIKDAFLGIGLVTQDGEHLSVSMRDSGFELAYLVGDSVTKIELKNGVINLK